MASRKKKKGKAENRDPDIDKLCSKFQRLTSETKPKNKRKRTRCYFFRQGCCKYGAGCYFQHKTFQQIELSKAFGYSNSARGYRRRRHAPRRKLDVEVQNFDSQGSLQQSDYPQWGWINIQKLNILPQEHTYLQQKWEASYQQDAGRVCSVKAEPNSDFSSDACHAVLESDEPEIKFSSDGPVLDETISFKDVADGKWLNLAQIKEEIKLEEDI